MKSRRRKFDLFTRTMLSLTGNCFSKNADLKVNPPISDIFLAGSDQIWNTKTKNGKNPAFFLDFVPKNAINASYANNIALIFRFGY